MVRLIFLITEEHVIVKENLIKLKTVFYPGLTEVVIRMKKLASIKYGKGDIR